MAPSIEVDEDVLDVLKRNAEPFVDTPNSVLRRLVGIDPVPGQTSPPEKEQGDPVASHLPAERKPRRPIEPRRAAAGTILAEEEYELPLLRALNELGGTAPYREILQRVEQLMSDQLTEVDRATLRSGGVRWQSRLQFVRLRLIERGLMDRDAPRGLWGLTDAGRIALEEGRTK